MDIHELFIAHILWGTPDMVHITPDGKKLYFLLFRNLMCIDAEAGSSFKDKSDDQISQIVRDFTIKVLQLN